MSRLLGSDGREVSSAFFELKGDCMERMDAILTCFSCFEAHSLLYKTLNWGKMLLVLKNMKWIPDKALEISAAFLYVMLCICCPCLRLGFKLKCQYFI